MAHSSPVPRGAAFAGPSRPRSADMLQAESPAVPPIELHPLHTLARAAAHGDRSAAERLLRTLLPRVRNLVRYLVRRDHEVDDLSQEALVNILRGLSTFRGEGSLQAWADRIVVRTVFAHLRRQRARDQHLVELTPELLPAAEPAQSTLMARRRALEALDQVPDDQRNVLVLHHVVGLGVRDIADELSVPFETVRSRLRLGMARLRRALGAHDEREVRIP